MYELRDYQKEGSDKCLNYLASKSKKGAIASFATGAGKSLIIANVVKEFGEPVLCLQPSKELLQQNLEKAQQMSIRNIGVYSASMKQKELSSNLTYATLGSVKKQVKELKALGVRTLVIDECHFKFSESAGSEFQTFLKAFQPEKVLGFTATPFKLTNGHQLGSKIQMLNRIRGKVFHDIIHVTQNGDMVDRGWWTPLEYEVHEFDDSGLILNTTGSDYTEDSIKASLTAQGVNNNVYLRVKKLRKQGVKNCLVFVDSIETAKKLAEVVPDSACVHSKTSDKERTSIIQKFKSGELFCVFNVNLLTTGFDFPALESIIIARPTNSLVLYSQMVGRVVRKFDGKESALVIDFCGNFGRFGGVEDFEILDFPNYGWGVFCGEKLMTGVYLEHQAITRSDLGGKKSFKDAELTFGKHQGKKISQLLRMDPGYLKYLLENLDTDTPYKVELLHSIRSVINYSTIS